MMRQRKLKASLVENDWANLQRRQRNELAREVSQFCIGRTLSEVAVLINKNEEFVGECLDRFGVLQVLGERRFADDLDFLQEYVASCQIVTDDDGESFVAGDDAEALEPIVDEYYEQGYAPEIAFRIAMAVWSASRAVEEGVVA